MSTDGPQPQPLTRPGLFDTAVWSWVRDRRHPHLADWFDLEAGAGRILVCDIVIMELVRTTPNRAAATTVDRRLEGFKSIPMLAELWTRARDVQMELSAAGDHRRVPLGDLLIAAAAEAADVPVIHYDRDYERISAVTGQSHGWFVADGTLRES